MIIAQALKLSNDLVKVSVSVSLVPWNHPGKKRSIIACEQNEIKRKMQKRRKITVEIIKRVK